MAVLAHIHLIPKFLIQKVIVVQEYRIILRLDVLLFLDMRLGSEEMTDFPLFPEVERQAIFGILFVLLGDDS